VIIPKENERDLVEVPDSVKADIIFKPVQHVEEVLEMALQPAPTNTSAKLKRKISHHSALAA
jgi:ATP-dependent Lon protease